MPFKRRTGKKKLNPQYVEDPSTRNNFELITDNIDEIFRRLNKQRWSVSEESSGSYIKTGTTFESPPTMKVKLECTGKNPVLVFMRQRSELISGTATTGGGIKIRNQVAAGGLGYFIIGNKTRHTIIHGVTLGGAANSLVAPIDYYLYYPASAVFAVELEAVAGQNVFELFVAAATANESVLLEDCELFAVELF